MTRTRFALVLLAVAAFAPAAPAPKAKKAPPHPMTVGTKWEYICHGDETNVHAQEITESEEKDGVVRFKVQETWGKFEIVLTHEWAEGVLGLVSNGTGRFIPRMTLRRDEMKAGDTWTEKYEYNTGRLSETSEFTVTVGEPEEITTPAGTFKTLPLTEKEKRSGTVRVYWYADGVGLVRQTWKDQPVRELKSFTPAPAKK